MKIETRVFNKRTGKMVYMPILIATGFSVMANIAEKESFEATDPVMIKTSMQDVDKRWLWEGDIVECGIVTSYGAIKDIGVVTFRADLGSFTININKAHENNTTFDVVDAKYLGDIYTTPELLKK